LLHSVSGLLAIVDENRQIVALNDSFLQMLGLEDPEEALGLRHGDALNCIHAEDEPGGCGATKFCSSCGAAVAIVSSLKVDMPVDRMCALSARRGDQIIDLALLVRSQPISIEQRRFLLIFLQDITRQQQWAALERAFFHDIGNMLYMLVGTSELLLEEAPSALAEAIHQASLRLHREIAIQRSLSQSEAYTYQPMRRQMTTKQVVGEIQTFFANHPVARDKFLKIKADYPDIQFNTDLSLLTRVLCNMITNAFEATDAAGVVEFWIEREDVYLSFCVWNEQEMSPDSVRRIFQRNFSTKAGAGRGIGTFSMKLFGEKILGGEVSFRTSDTQGTVFKFSHPI
jgi:signal transduction histidine kinase